MTSALQRKDGSDASVAASIARPRLVARLAAAAEYPITLLIAPAGYGKSIVLRQYLASLDVSGIRFVLRAEHVTLLGFLRGFTEAMREAAPHAITSLAGAYERSTSSPQSGVELAAWMHAHLESFAGVIAIDDLHLADGDPQVARFLASIVERTKGKVRWVLASRSTTGLPVGTWLAYRDADLAIDEQELRFTINEARAAATQLGATVRDDELGELLELTEGWPAAMSFALRTSMKSTELRNVSAVTREMTYRLLAEQVYATLDQEERHLLELAVALPVIDVRVLERAGFDRALVTVERLRERTAFLHEESAGIYQCHDLFREFLRHQAALGGRRAQQIVHERAARALEAAGDVEHAVSAYVTAASLSDVIRLLELHGFDLLERARGDVVAQAIEALDDKTRRENAVILSLQGALQATAGKFARAESLLRRAITRAGNNRDIKAIASLRLASLLANEGEDVTELLLAVGEDSGQSASHRAEAYSLIAGQRAVSNDAARASEAVAKVEQLMLDVDSDTVRAKALHHIGIAFHHLGMPERAFEVLTQSSELSAELHLYGIASRANAVLSNLALHERDDGDNQLNYAEAAAAAATKAGDAFALQTALLQMLSAKMRAGDAEESVAIEQTLSTVHKSELATRYLTFFRSLRLAWEGRFGEAHQLVSQSWSQLPFTFDRALSGSEYALFLALDGRAEKSIKLTKEILRLLTAGKVAGLFRIRLTAIARILCALAEAINGRMTYADRILQGAKNESDPVVSLTIRSVDVLLARLRRRGPAGTPSIQDLIGRLSSLGYSDLGKLLGAVDRSLARNEVEVSSRMELTRSERDVLQALAEGFIPKEIAARTGRSVYTVRVHIANAITKLGCHGRHEAVHEARRLGLIGSVAAE
jgi:ATP/maltotriose-dependent transcriptional regulator MalT